MTYSRRIRLSPIWVAIALALAIVLLAFAAVPAFAIVHPCAPIGEGVNRSGGSAGGVAGFAGSSNSPEGPPFPAQGGEKSGENSPDNGSTDPCP